MMYLRFDSQSAMLTAFKSYLYNGKMPENIGPIAIDVLGVVYKQKSPGLLSTVGNLINSILPIFEAQPGYCVNLSDRIPALAKYEIAKPNTPSRVFV